MYRERIDSVTNSSVYRKLLTKRIIRDYGLCHFCFKACNNSMYGGENLTRKYIRNWKDYRRTQYKSLVDLTIYPNGDCSNEK